MTLTLARLKQVLHYDQKTGDFTWLCKLGWRGPVGTKAGTIGKTGYRQITIDQGRYVAHRLAWLYCHGEWPSAHIDHINRNPLDNRIENLRIATQPQNMANTPGHRDSATGLKGVSRKRNKWSARIRANGKTHLLGCYDTPAEAHQAYIAAAVRLNGEFARWQQ